MSDPGWFLTLDTFTQLFFAAAKIGFTVLAFLAVVVFVIFAFSGRG